MNFLRLLYRMIRGYCIECGVKRALPLPRLYAAIGIDVPSTWCRDCHPRWKKA